MEGITLETVMLYINERTQEFIISDEALDVQYCYDNEIYDVVISQRSDIEKFCETALDKYKRQNYPACQDDLHFDFILFMNPQDLHLFSPKAACENETI